MKRVLWIGSLIVILAIGSVYLYYSSQPEQNLWAKMYLGAGSVSTPRPVDLNNDGILDLVMGGGAEEFEPTEYAVLAIDGNTGEIIWQVPGINQMVGSAIFKDINADSVQDVFIGGRSAQFFAIDGKTGELIWEYMKSYEGLNLERDTTLLNFFNPQFIPDRNGDGVDDLLTSFGGFVAALPGNANRPVGWLMIIDTMTGEELGRFPMPDGKETYMSPVLDSLDGKLKVIFGSGGETVSGNLYRMDIDAIISGNTASLEVLDSGQGKGFIAPPALIDLNADGTEDMVVNSMNGRILMIDGKSGQKVWENQYAPYAETESMTVPFDMDGNGEFELFGTIGLGVWPRIDTVIHVVLEAKTGNQLFMDTLGIMQLASPVSYDIDDDGREEIIQYVNSFKDRDYFDRYYSNWVRIYQFDGDESYDFSPERAGANIGSTPLVTDLDGDGATDFVFCYITDDRDLTNYTHLVVERIEMNIPFNDSPWRSYMSTNYNSHND